MQKLLNQMVVRASACCGAFAMLMFLTLGFTAQCFSQQVSDNDVPVDAYYDPQPSDPQPNMPAPVLDIPASSPATSLMPKADPPQSVPRYQIEFDRVDPRQFMKSISQDMQSSLSRESQHLDGIRAGIETLRERNELLQSQQNVERRKLFDARLRAERAEQLAADARRDAEESRAVTMETVEQLFQMQQQQAELQRELSARVPVPIPVKAAAPGSQPVTGAGSQPPPELTATPLPPSAPDNPPVAVTDSVVDSQALADNLFGAKDYRSALSIYLELLKEPPEGADAVWFDYQAACCYRNLREFDMAERYYRRVAGEGESHLAAIARWWLATIGDQRDVRGQINSWKSDLQSEQGK